MCFSMLDNTPKFVFFLTKDDKKTKQNNDLNVL